MGRDAYSIDEYTQLNAIIRKGGDRIPICFCIDVSRSMQFLTNPMNEFIVTGQGHEDGSNTNIVEIRPGYVAHTRIEELKRVLGKMIQEMKMSPILSQAAIIDVIVFGQFADFLIGPVGCHDFNNQSIERISVDAVDGGTQTAMGIEMALEKIDFLTSAIEEAGTASYLPVLVLMSDGDSTDIEASKIAAQKLQRRSAENKLNVIPIAIGRDTAWMRSLSHTNKIYHMNYTADFDEVFNRITKRIGYQVDMLAVDASFQQKQDDIEDTPIVEDGVASTVYGDSINDDDALLYLLNNT